MPISVAGEDPFGCIRSRANICLFVLIVQARVFISDAEVLPRLQPTKKHVSMPHVLVLIWFGVALPLRVRGSDVICVGRRMSPCRCKADVVVICVGLPMFARLGDGLERQMLPVFAWVSPCLSGRWAWKADVVEYAWITMFAVVVVAAVVVVVY